MSRINLGQSAPELYKKVAELDALAMQKVQEAQLNEGFAHLLKLRASQINQCAFCIRMHAQDALKTGESAERIALLNAWRETEYYDQAERAALALMEAITLIAVDQVPDAIYEDALPFLTDAQISAIEWLAIVINAWNRIAISSRYSVKP
ncbi:carboxymuconolactone decarboxylase family protein [Acinetobacter cumulans]|uniref:Carboxymuconolactone decarboxylase family protein n=1 Tax=Acinetobacter cumulans TaxID=2136182 RepID=A0ABX9U979_9GAMM|nr:carboxymuconolactone decarboxylase family protein [Acinetobacter cumulans]QCO21147.1 carboxymuconolactone decarboxylase family protein [Acinetobacter cumulans]RLL49246.1 carboxymuconolactone decarboxylase family protein [Acinetobacter cumulans]